MLNFFGTPSSHSPGRSRRGFLKAGSAGIGGLTLANLLQMEAQAGIRSSRKSVINIHLDGGPPQMDLIDPKADAPEEIRGPFAEIATKIPGVHFTELLPQLAANADKFAFIRSLVGAAGRHNAFQCQSGFSEKDLSGLGGRPALGCVVSKLQGRPDDSAPAFVDLMQGRPLARNSARPGFLGPAFRSFRPDLSHLFKRQLEPGMQAELSRLGEGVSLQLDLVDGLSVGRMENRIGLLQNLDLIRREIDRSGSMAALDTFTEQAFGILTSGEFAAAMDLTREDPRVVERFTPRMKGPNPAHYTTESPKAVQKFLLARRLVEAGVRCVSVSLSDFDTHSANFERMRYLGPVLDHALATLVNDLEERGMLDDVMIVAWGEFGRTPKVNTKGGRDHWPRVGMCIMAGGGMNTGQVIGATDRIASEATVRPIHYQDVMATLYHHLGIDGRSTTLSDTSGRPQYLIESGRPIRELVG
jgi:uncharacterized protein (DUF1501 family)